MRSFAFGVFLAFSSSSLFAEVNTAAPTAQPFCFPDALTNQTNAGSCWLSARENYACNLNTYHGVSMTVGCPSLGGSFTENFYNWGNSISEIQANFVTYMANYYNITAVCASTSGTFYKYGCNTNNQQSFGQLDCNFQIDNADTLEPACNSGSSLMPSWGAVLYVSAFLAAALLF